MSAHPSLFPDIYSDLVLTQLQETGEVWLTDGATLGELLGLVETLGINPNDVVIRRGGARQIHLKVLP
jgi:hypothetical protein